MDIQDFIEKNKERLNSLKLLDQLLQIPVGIEHAKATEPVATQFMIGEYSALIRDLEELVEESHE